MRFIIILSVAFCYLISWLPNDQANPFPWKEYDQRAYYFADYSESFHSRNSISIIDFRADTIFILDFSNRMNSSVTIKIAKFLANPDKAQLDYQLVKTLYVSLNAISVMFYSENCDDIITIGIDKSGDLLKDVEIEYKFSRSKLTGKHEVTSINQIARFKEVTENDPCIGEKLCCSYEGFLRFRDFNNASKLIKCEE